MSIETYKYGTAEVDTPEEINNIEYGMILQNNSTDPDHDIDMTIGKVIDSTYTYMLEGSILFTKKIDTSWTVGHTNGGLAYGVSLSTDTWYHYFALYNPTLGTTDGGFDTDINAANLLADPAVIAAGYTHYRRRGSILTDGSSNIRQFHQYKNVFYLLTPILDVNTTSQGTSAVTYTLSTPSGIEVTAIYNLYATDDGSAGGGVYVFHPDFTVTNPSTSLAPLYTAYNHDSGGGLDIATQLFTLTNQSSQIKIISDVTLDNLKIATIGWIDEYIREFI